MKLRKFLGGLLFGLGCAVILIGLMAAVLPMIDNDQLRLVLSSFAMPSQNAVVGAFNVVMTYALHNCYLMMLYGAAMIGAGLLLSPGLVVREPEPERNEPPRPARAQPAYTVAADDRDDRDDRDVPVWRAQPQAQANPFADASLAQMLAPKGTVAAPASANPFAAEPLLKDEPTAYQPPIAASDAYKPPVARVEAATASPGFAPAVTQAVQAVAASPTYAPAAQPSAQAPQATAASPAYAPVAPQPPVAVSTYAPPAEPPKPAAPDGTEVIYRSPSLREPTADERLRSTFHSPSFKSAPSAGDAVDEAISAAMPERKPSAQPVPSRIKSTMGKHS